MINEDDVLTRVCSSCEHYTSGPGGTYCVEYGDDILDEAIAIDCPGYDPVPWAGVREEAMIDQADRTDGISSGDTDIRPKVLINMLMVACFYKEMDPVLSLRLTERASLLALDISRESSHQ